MEDRRGLGPLRSYVVDLKGLFSHPRPFRIPPYQRAYAWRHEEVNRLFEDLRDAYEAGRVYYFLGTIVLIVDQAEADDVVDGQQRLATFTLLLAALRDRLAEIGDPLAMALHDELQALIVRAGAPRLALRTADLAFMASYVQTPGRIGDLCALYQEAQEEEGPDAMPASQAHLVFAAQTIMHALEASEGLDVAAFARHVLDAAQFNVIETSDREGAPHMFTVLNDTGLDLSAADLIKSELLIRSDLSETEAVAMAEAWERKVDLIGRNAMDELFKALPVVLSQGGVRKPGEPPADFRSAMTRIKDPRAFLESDLDRYVQAYHTIREANVEYGNYSREINRRLRCLAMIKEKQWLPAALLAFTEAAKAPSFLRNYLLGLERFSFACALAAIDSGARQKRFFRILNAGIDPDALFGPKGAMNLTDKENRELLERMGKPSRREAKRRRLVVFKTNAALGEPLDLDHDDATVEHVLPLKGSGEWTRLFADPQQRGELAGRLGNMILVTSAQNDAAADKVFARKREIYFAPGMPVRALTRDIADIAKWGPEEVHARQRRLLAALAADWGIPDSGKG